MPARFFVVWGMHRSGTSLLAGLTQFFGADAGRQLQPADRFNEKGYFEDTDLTTLNSAMLAELGMQWFSLSAIGQSQAKQLEKAGFMRLALDFLRLKSKSAPIVALKDPRMTRLALFWRAVFKNAGIEPVNLIAWREPLAVARSLKKRADLLPFFSPVQDLDYGIYLWLGYTLSALVHTKGMARALISYEQAIADPARVLKLIAERFGLDFNEDAARDFAARFVDCKLNHGGASDSEMLPESARKLTDILASAENLAVPEYDFRIWPRTQAEIDLARFCDMANLAAKAERSRSKQNG